MAENTAIDIVNKLSARMAQETVEEYVENGENALLNIPRITEMVEKITLNDIEGYKKAMELKSALCSLSCYVANNGKKNWEEVWDLESKLGRKIDKFTRNYGRASKDARPLVKYFLWTHHFTTEGTENQVKMANLLIANQHLWKDENRNYLVSGLHLAVGDNTFTIGDGGREYRNYVKSCVIQAFWVSLRWERILNNLEEKREITVPQLDESIYRKVAIRDGKGAAKISFNRKDKKLVFDNHVRGGNG